MMQGAMWAEGRALIREALRQRRRSRWRLAEWGFEVGASCPRCGRPQLRQGKVARAVVPGDTAGQLDGSVRVCRTRGCKYAAFRAPDGTYLESIPTSIRW
jgi:hypothetical protein